MEERQFKGVWIPREIWLSEELTLQEKVILVEIDSLETDVKGCYSSNKYFSEFFKLTPQRVSQIIKSLEKKNYLKVDYITKEKQVLERQLRIKKPPYPEVSNKFDRGIKYPKGGYQENFKDNNTSINKKEINKESFDRLWSLYPNKKGKDKAYKSFEKALKDGVAVETIENGITQYLDFIKNSKVEPQYIKHGSTWFNQRCWEDEYDIPKKEETIDVWY